MKYCLIYIDNGLKEISQLDEEDLNDTSLKSFVEFFWRFKNEDNLKEYLYYKGFIDSFNGDFFIGYHKGSDVKLLPYSLAYASDKNFFNINKLIDYYNAHLTDPKFMELFTDKFIKPLRNTPHVGLILDSLNEDYQKYLATNLLSNETHTLMTNFIIKYINVKTKHGIKQNFTRLRELAMFAIQFKNSTTIKTNQDEDNQKIIELQITHYKQLLMNESIDCEERKSYQEVIDALQAKLDIMNISRRRKR